jgi:hypothetical protein
MSTTTNGDAASATDERRQRLHDLIDLARATRGLTRAALGKALGRDPTKVYPESGNPKTDFLVSLASILEWPAGDVVEFIWGGEAGPMASPAAIIEPKPGVGGKPEAGGDASFEDLFHIAREQHKDGRFRAMVDTSALMYRVAENEDRRAFACAMEASAWDGLGRYTQEVDACRRGLAHKGVSAYTRNILRADLANAWYCLWDLTPALGTATFLLEHYEANPPTRKLDEKRPAFVRYVRGHTRRRLAGIEPDVALDHYRMAVADLEASREAYTRLAEELDDRSLLGIANTCKGGIDECLVELGERKPYDAVEEVLALAGSREDGAWSNLTGDELESIGWRCVFASNIALRHVTGRDLQSAMRLLTETALDAADRLDNWAMRERVFTIQLNLHRTLSDTTGLELPLTIDSHERTLITQAMGRFPGFREAGWDLLSRATVVERKGGAA